MKKFLCLILTVFLGVGVFVFASCKKDAGYDLKNLSADYENLTAELNAFKYDDKKIVIDYSAFSNAVGVNNLTDAIRSKPYNYLNNYNTIFNNSISFINSYIEICSTAQDVNKGLRNEVKDNLNNLLVAMQKVDLLTENFAEQLNFSVSNNKTEIYLSTFQYLLNSYGELYSSTYDLTISLSRVYYNYLLKNANPNIFETPIASFDVSDVLVNLESRAKYEIAALSYGFYKTNIENAEIDEPLTENTAFINLDAYTEYSNKINQISVPVSVDLYKTVLDADTLLKQQFREYSIELYNIQTCLNNDFEKFYKAKSMPKSSSIVDDYYYLLEKNYEALSKILTLFY